MRLMNKNVGPILLYYGVVLAKLLLCGRPDEECPNAGVGRR